MQVIARCKAEFIAVLLAKKKLSPDSHALLNVSWGHLVPQAHYELRNLLNVDHIFCVIGIRVDNLGASCNLQRRRQGGGSDQITGGRCRARGPPATAA